MLPRPLRWDAAERPRLLGISPFLGTAKELGWAKPLNWEGPPACYERLCNDLRLLGIPSAEVRAADGAG